MQLDFFGKFIEPNDEILITQSEHASNVLPWFRLVTEKGAVVKYIPLDNNHYVTLENVKKIHHPKYKSNFSSKYNKRYWR